ncbi:MAG: hypothetical protein HY606_07385, partial [Planctomycetes bacterium]|nr:hypothetical protein [Planctomycetota bacterium]
RLYEEVKKGTNAASARKNIDIVKYHDLLSEIKKSIISNYQGFSSDIAKSLAVPGSSISLFTMLGELTKNGSISEQNSANLALSISNYIYSIKHPTVEFKSLFEKRLFYYENILTIFSHYIKDQELQAKMLELYEFERLNFAFHANYDFEKHFITFFKSINLEEQHIELLMPYISGFVKKLKNCANLGEVYKTGIGFLEEIKPLFDQSQFKMLSQDAYIPWIAENCYFSK